MKLLEAIKLANLEDIGLLERILLCIETRKDMIESQEPSWEPEFFYEKWEEKFDDISDIYDSLEELIRELQDEDLEEDNKVDLSASLISVINNIEEHQNNYGGLKRLRV